MHNKTPYSGNKTNIFLGGGTDPSRDPASMGKGEVPALHIPPHLLPQLQTTSDAPGQLSRIYIQLTRKSV